MTEMIITADLIREAYTIIETLFDDLLKRSEELYVTDTPLDVVSLLLEKIDIVKKDYSQDLDVLNQLKEVENEIYSRIINRFTEEFISPEEEFIDLNDSNINIPTLALFLYNTFYLKRRINLLRYLVNSTINQKKALVKKFKTPSSKKDLTYQAIRNELRLDDNDYYILLMFSSDIFDTFVGDENTDVKEYILHSDISEEEEQIASKIFQYNGIQIMNNLKASVKDYKGYRQLRTIYKDLLFSRIRNIANANRI